MSGSNALQPRHHTVTRAVRLKSARVTGDRRRMVARNVARDKRHRTYLLQSHQEFCLPDYDPSEGASHAGT